MTTTPPMPPNSSATAVNHNDATVSNSVSGDNILNTLPDAQLFSKDPEDYSQQDMHVIVDRLKTLLSRYRKARQDDEQLAALTAKIRAANTKAKKPKKDPFDETHQ